MPTVMEYVFMGLHALRADATRTADGNTAGILERISRDLALLPASYHGIEASKENEAAAMGGVAAARAQAAQAAMQHTQLLAQTEGGGAQSVQREIVQKHNALMQDQEHKDVIEKSKKLAEEQARAKGPGVISGTGPASAASLHAQAEAIKNAKHVEPHVAEDEIGEPPPPPAKPVEPVKPAA